MASMADASEMARRQGLADSLAKIRHQTASKLANQRAPAQLLVAVESTLQESSGTKTFSPTAYLMALIAMLDKASSQSGSDSSASLLSSTLYLLALVTPYVSPAVLHAQVHALIEPLSVVLSNTQHTISNDVAESQAALLRSALGIFEPLLLALASDRAMLSSNLPIRGCWNATLRLCLDARPKVRRRAQDLVGQVLQYSDTIQDSMGNTKAHPFAVKTAEWATAALAEVSASGSVTKKQAPKYDVKTGRAQQPEVAAAARQKNIDGGNANSGIWICGFLRMLAPTLPSKSIPSLTSNLLRVISQNNPFLSAAAFEVFESLFKISRPMAIQNGLSTQTLGSSSMSSNAANTRSVHADALVSTLDALLSPAVKPKVTDIQLIGPYLRAVENATVAYSRVQDGQPAWERVPIVWSIVKEMAFSSQSKASRDAISVRMAGRDCLSAIVRYCIPDSAIEKACVANSAGKEKDELLKIINFFDEAFSKNALRYSHSWPEIFGVLTALVLRLRYKPKMASTKSSKNKLQQSIPAATILMLPLLSIIGQLRSQPKFEHREQVDGVISALVQVCGPKSVLDILPLGLLGENGAQNGRAWLLPLMRSSITNTTLAHFVQIMVPMSEALFNKQAEAEELNANGKPTAPVQAKVYEALTEQIWALLPGYCDLPMDMLDALTQQFVELLANVLYSQPSLRPSICRALQVLVDRSQSLARSAAPSEMLLDNFGVSTADGKQYVARLAEIAPNLLAVFFNIFSQSPGESRGYVADCMTAYMGIMTEEEIGRTYQKIVNTLEQSLPTLQQGGNKDSGPKSIPPIPHTMMDLLILMVPFLTQAEADALFALGTSDALFAHRDAAIQKKSYRVLARLMEGSRGAKVLGVGENESGKLPELLEKLQATTGSVVVGAKRDRTALLASIMPLIPSTELHVLPSIIPEAVLATKEVNQGARELAYRLLVEMGNKMDAGGMIKRGLMEGEENDKNDDEDADMDSKTVSANINEYITMVAAGLAGTSPHMISASITALARLVYEFHEKVPSQTLEEMVGTMDIFLASPNREVAKSALGFVKVTIVSLPAEVIDINLPGLVGALFSSSNHHRIHFKAKIRHIFERLLRRFGYERIEQLTDEDNRKLLVNIRKRKERSKRKKAGQDEAAMEQDDDDEIDKPQMGQRAQKSIGADAFEEAIYGSESEISDSDDDGEDGQVERNGKGAASSKGQKRDKNISAIEQEYLLQDDDAPMDLLDRGALASGGKVISSGGKQPSMSRKRQPGQEASKFTLDGETGRMVIEDSDEAQSDEDEKAENQIDVEGAGRAYLDRERGVHGMSTDKNGKVRLNKNNKRNRAADEEMEAEQIELEEQLAALQRQREAASETLNGTSATNNNNKKRKQERKQIGQEFRAKKAGGDIKRGETSPFAYVPLQKVGGKKPGKAGKSDIRFLGKDKKRRS